MKLLSRREVTLILITCLLITVPFLNKAVHADDTFVLHISQNILTNPLDPFAGDFDWFGHRDSVWEQTTNPPLISYWLAPFLAIGNGAEWILHGAMIPFFLMLGIGMFFLSKRFLGQSWIPFLFLIASPAVVVSGNLMRDIPALGLATLGLSLSLRGADERKSLLLLIGVFLLGLSALTKYSFAVLLGPLALYLVLKRRSFYLVWLTVPTLMMAAWCVFTWIIYGQAHPLYLLLERTADPGIYWPDKLISAFTILGSSVYLVPVLLLCVIQKRSWSLLAGSLTGCAVLWVGSNLYYQSGTDWQFLLWTLPGGILLLIASWEGIRNAKLDHDKLFLLAWVWIPFLFSVFFVPFQAVRHLLPVIPAILLLLFQFLEEHRTPKGNGLSVMNRKMLHGFLVIQVLMTLIVSAADYEYAGVYRKFIESEKWSQHTNGEKVWFVGHWGWMHYAQRAGLLQLHREGPFPSPGELLIWPEKVHIGDAFSKHKALADRLELAESIDYTSMVPFRTLSLEARAGFYATIKQRIPYRFDPKTPLEVIRIYRVVRSNNSR